MVNREAFAFLSIAAIGLSIIPAHAEEECDDDHNEHHAQEAHLHGAWELFAALDDKQLSVTVKGPLIDVVEFEHQPTSDEEFAAIQNLKTRLGAPQTMFKIDERARCAVAQPAEILLPQGFESESVNGEKESLHLIHENDAQHDHNTHKAETNHDDDHKGYDIHGSDVEVVYVFECKTPARIRSITATGFNAFPAIESIEAVFLGNNTQKAFRLTRNSKSLQID